MSLNIEGNKMLAQVIEHEYLWVVVEYYILNPIHVLKKCLL